MKTKNNEKETRAIVTKISLETRDAEGAPIASRKISGYAAVFNQWSNPLSWFREKIDPGAFDEARFDDCILCFNHNSEKLLARKSSGTLTLKTDETGLYFEAELPNTTDGDDVLEMVRRGDIDSCSFCFIVKESIWKETVGDDELEERTITKISDVLDVSPVVRPAYSQTSVSIDERSLKEERKKALAGIHDVDMDSRYRTMEVLKRKYI